MFTREQLLAEVWGYRDGSGARTVDSHVRALRRKLGTDVIRTVHGVGYARRATAVEASRDAAGRSTGCRSIKLKLGVVIVAAVGRHRRSVVLGRLQRRRRRLCCAPARRRPSLALADGAGAWPAA